MLPVLSPLAKGTLGHPLISRRRDLSEKWLGKYIGSNALDYSTGACFDTEVTVTVHIYSTNNWPCVFAVAHRVDFDYHSKPDFCLKWDLIAHIWNILLKEVTGQHPWRVTTRTPPQPQDSRGEAPDHLHNPRTPEGRHQNTSSPCRTPDGRHHG